MDVSDLYANWKDRLGGFIEKRWRLGTKGSVGLRPEDLKSMEWSRLAKTMESLDFGQWRISSSQG